MNESGRSQPLVVLHSATTWLPQTQTWMYNQAYYLPSDIHLHVVCEQAENLEQFGLPNLHVLKEAGLFRYVWEKGVRKLNLRQHLPFLIDVAKREQAQVLHSHFGNIGWGNLEAARQTNLKHVVTFYGQDVNSLPKQNPRWHDRYQQLFAHVDRVLCEGPHMAMCIQELGCPAEKVQVHHLGVSVESIAFQPRVWHPGEPLRVLIAASFREKKGIPNALAALARLQVHMPVEITVIGDASADPTSQAEKAKILATIEQHHLQPTLLGYQPHAVFFEQAYQHHVFLSPSLTAHNGDTEGGAPVAILEAVATGMMVVSTTHCDIPNVLQNPEREFLAAEQDVDGIVQHLEWLVEHPDQWAKIAAAGRSHIQAEFDAQIQGARLAAIYRSLGANP